MQDGAEGVVRQGGRGGPRLAEEAELQAAGGLAVQRNVKPALRGGEEEEEWGNPRRGGSSPVAH